MTPNYVVMYATVWVLSRICRPQEEPLSAGRVRVHTCCECYNKRGVRIQKFLFHFPFCEIYRRLLFFTLGRSVSAWLDYSTTKRNRQTRQHQEKRPTWSPVYVHSLVCLAQLLLLLLLLHYVLLVSPARCFFLFLPTLLRKLHGDGCCCTEPSEKFRVRPRYDYEKKTCESWLQDVLRLLSFLLWCSDDRRKNTRTGTPWCIADWLLQVLRSRLITTNY